MLESMAQNIEELSSVLENRGQLFNKLANNIERNLRSIQDFRKNVEC